MSTADQLKRVLRLIRTVGMLLVILLSFASAVAGMINASVSGKPLHLIPIIVSLPVSWALALIGVWSQLFLLRISYDPFVYLAVTPLIVLALIWLPSKISVSIVPPRAGG